MADEQDPLVTARVTLFVPVRKRSGRPRSDPDQKKADPTILDPVGGRQCSKCYRWLTLTSFHKNRSAVDGLALHCKLCVRSYADGNREDLRERSRRNNHELRQAALDHYGRSCACCGETAEEFLAIDHVFGNGNDHRKEIGVGAAALYLWLKRNGYPPGFRALCHNCNLAIGFYGYCPHQNSVKPKMPTFPDGRPVFTWERVRL